MQNIIAGRSVYQNSQYKSTKVLLGCFSNKCPKCGRKRNEWKIDLPTINDIKKGIIKPPVREHGTYDIVRYRCQCGCVFKKIEATE